MEEIITKVMSIDREANEIMNQAKQNMEERQKDIKARIEAMKAEIMEKKKCEAKELYDSIIVEAESKAEDIRNNTKIECDQLEKRYFDRKVKMDGDIFTRIFN